VTRVFVCVAAAEVAAGGGVAEEEGVVGGVPRVQFLHWISWMLSWRLTRWV